MMLQNLVSQLLTIQQELTSIVKRDMACGLLYQSPIMFSSRSALPSSSSKINH